MGVDVASFKKMMLTQKLPKHATQPLLGWTGENWGWPRWAGKPGLQGKIYTLRLSESRKQQGEASVDSVACLEMWAAFVLFWDLWILFSVRNDSRGKQLHVRPTDSFVGMRFRLQIAFWDCATGRPVPTPTSKFVAFWGLHRKVKVPSLLFSLILRLHPVVLQPIFPLAYYVLGASWRFAFFEVNFTLKKIRAWKLIPLHD